MAHERTRRLVFETKHKNVPRSSQTRSFHESETSNFGDNISWKNGETRNWSWQFESWANNAERGEHGLPNSRATTFCCAACAEYQRSFRAPIDEIEVEPCLMMTTLIGSTQAPSLAWDGERTTRVAYLPIPIWIRWFKVPTDVSPFVWNRSGSPQWWGPSGGWEILFMNASSLVLWLSLLRDRHAVPLKSHATKSTFWSNVRMSFFYSTFLSINGFLNCATTGQWMFFWPLSSGRRKRGTR